MYIIGTNENVAEEKHANIKVIIRRTNGYINVVTHSDTHGHTEDTHRHTDTHTDTDTRMTHGSSH